MILSGRPGVGGWIVSVLHLPDQDGDGTDQSDDAGNQCGDVLRRPHVSSVSGHW